jgi:hypothetical protein
MMHGDTGNNTWYDIFLNGISRFTGKLARSQKTHNYVHQQQNRDYVFEQTAEKAGYMTGQGKGIQQGDYIIFEQKNRVVLYRVQTISYYASPSDMWIALLAKIK